jgi:hypothetical protein
MERVRVRASIQLISPYDATSSRPDSLFAAAPRRAVALNSDGSVQAQNNQAGLATGLNCYEMISSAITQCDSCG